MINNQQQLNKTSGIFATNPKLTGNIKLVLENNELSLNSIQNAQNIDMSRQYNEHITYGANIVEFVNKHGLRSSLYDVHNFDIAQVDVQSDYVNQFNDVYQWGAKPTEYHNKIRFFAPLWHVKDDIPESFIIYARKIDNSTPANTEYDDILTNSTPIAIIDIAASPLHTVLTELQNDQAFSNSPLLTGLYETTCNGISIVTGRHTKEQNITFGDAINEHSILTHDNNLTNSWQHAELICTNLINVEFIIDIDVAYTAYYEFFGVYSSTQYSRDVANDDVNVDIAAAPFNLHTNTITLLRTASNALQVANNNHAVNPISKELQTTLQYDTNSVGFITTLYQRHVSFNVTANIEIGDVIKLYENDVAILTLTCATVNSDTEFKQESTIYDTLVSLAAKFNAKVLLLETFEFVMLVNDTTVTLNSNSYMDESALAITRLAKFTFDESLHDIISGSDVAHLYHTIDSNDTLKLYNIAHNDEILAADFVRLAIDGVLSDHIVHSIIQHNNAFYVKLASKFTKPANIYDNEYSFEFSAHNYVYSTLELQKIYDICVFDNTLQQSEPNQADFDMQRYEYYMRNDAPFTYITCPTATAEMEAAFDLYFADQADTEDLYKYMHIANFVQDIDNYVFVAANNEYDRLQEYYLTNFATKSIISPVVIKWAHTYGNNAANSICRSNKHMQFRANNFSPAQYSIVDYHTHDYTLSWFLIGTVPPPYATFDDVQILKSHISTNGITIAALQSTSIDAYLTYLEHKNLVSTYAYDTINCWSVVQSKSSSKYATVMYKGVEYLVDEQYIDYRFAVILIVSTEYYLQPDLQLIANDTFNTLTLVVQYDVHEVFMTSMNYSISSLFVDRSIFYRNEYIIVCSTPNTALNSAYINLDIGEDATRMHISSPETNGIVYDSGTTYYFAMDFNVLPPIGAYDIDAFMQSLVGGNLTTKIFNDDGINIHIIEYMTVHDYHAEGYIWCYDIYVQSYDLITETWDTALSIKSLFSGADTSAWSTHAKALVIQNTSANSQIRFDYLSNMGHANRFKPLILRNAITNINDVDGIQINEPLSAQIALQLSTETFNNAVNAKQTQEQITYPIARYTMPASPIMRMILPMQALQYGSNLLHNTVLPTSTYIHDILE